MKHELLVTKSSGLREPFSILKLRRSLEKTQASPEQIDAIIETVLPSLYQGVSTKKIHSLAFRLLRKKSRPNAARYQLKKGIMELGPSGFPFEKFIAKVFEQRKYSVLTGQVLQGRCVSHEVDVVARKDSELVVVECKYRNSSAIAIDVKTPLYVHARFEDLLDHPDFKKSTEQVQGWLATNGRFTSDAITYSTCRGLNLLGWDYPKDKGLREEIDRAGLYPLTCLTSITKQEKQWLMAKNYILASEVFADEALLLKAGVSAVRLKVVAAEGNKLCRKPKPVVQGVAETGVK